MKLKSVDYSSSLGPVLKSLRKEKKMTLKGLGELSGVSYAQIAKIEKNMHKPSQKTIEKLGKALSVNIEELLDYAGYIVKNETLYEVDTETKFTTILKFRRTCQLCGAKAPNIEIVATYITPVEFGGTKDISNATLLCNGCYEARNKVIKKNGIDDDLLYLDSQKRTI